MPPRDLIGVSSGTITSWPFGLDRRVGDLAERPSVDVRASSGRSARPSRARARRGAIPPAAWTSVATKRPNGFRSATIGVRAEIASKSSIVKSISSSFAIATRWRTPFVEPPVAATEAAAFSSDAFVMICEGRTSRRDEVDASRPASAEASSFERSSAGMSFGRPG